MFETRRSFVGALLIVLLAFSFLAGAPPATSAVGDVDATPGQEAVLRREAGDVSTRVPPPPVRFGPGKEAPAATLVVTYHGFEAFPQAKAAFQAAVDIWAGQLSSSVPISIDATFTPLGLNILGSTRPARTVSNVPGAPVANTFYPVALANKLAGSDLFPFEPDIIANFNSTGIDWYFGTDGATPFGRSDFESVVLHELGHGLGFAGSQRVVLGQGAWGSGTETPVIYDRFAKNGSGQSLINTALFPNPSSALAAQLQSNNVFFDGPNTRAANGGSPAKLYSPSVWIQGSSYAHLDEATYPAGNPNSLMTPAIHTGESIHDPGPITRGIFRDLGWELNGTSTTSSTSSSSSTTSRTSTTSSSSTSTSSTSTRATFSLAISFPGAGGGTVFTSPPSLTVISCAARVCTGTYPDGTTVVLTSAPDPGSTFAGFSGDCIGATSCTVTMSRNRFVNAAFNLCGKKKCGKKQRSPALEPSPDEASFSVMRWPAEAAGAEP